ncbi:MAG: hypothetical protein HZR80_05855 [Candidatus Heimdallarchaeota archaeon]
MSPIGSKKRKIKCHFCAKEAEYMKIFDDFFCPKCLRFQTESQVKEIKLLPLLKLKKYHFAAHKHTYVIYNEMESKIGSCKRRDLSKYISKKNHNIRYYFFNDIHRIIASVDGKTFNVLNDNDASWKVYDYGRNFRGEILHIANSDTWQIKNSNEDIIALRDPKDGRAALQTARQFTMIGSNDPDKILFRIIRKGGFKLEILSADTDPHIAWGVVVAIHRRYYV